MVRKAALSERKSTLGAQDQIQQTAGRTEEDLDHTTDDHGGDEVGCVQHRLHHPLELCKAQLVDAQGQDDGDGEAPQQAVQAQQHGVLDHAHTVGCGEEPFKPVQANPLAAGDAAACLEIPERDLDAVHGPVLINDGQHHRDQQHHIELPVFPRRWLRLLRWTGIASS